MADEDDIERRIELAAKVKILDERTHHIEKAVDRIESHLGAHIRDEEAAFKNFLKIKSDMSLVISEFKDSMENKLDETVKQVEQKIEPIREDFRNIKTVYKVLATIGSILVTVIIFFKDNILGWFK